MEPDQLTPEDLPEIEEFRAVTPLGWEPLDANYRSANDDRSVVFDLADERDRYSALVVLSAVVPDDSPLGVVRGLQELIARDLTLTEKGYSGEVGGVHPLDHARSIPPNEFDLPTFEYSVDIRSVEEYQKLMADFSF